MKKPKKGKVHIIADIKVTSMYDTGKVKHGRFEKRIEETLDDAFMAYLEHLCTRLPDQDQYSWVKVGKKAYEYVKKS